MNAVVVFILSFIFLACSDDSKELQQPVVESAKVEADVYVNSSMFRELSRDEVNRGGSCAGFTSRVLSNLENRYKYIAYLDMDMVEIERNKKAVYHHVYGSASLEISNSELDEIFQSTISEFDETWFRFDPKDVKRRLPRNGNYKTNKYYKLSPEQKEDFYAKAEACNLDLTKRAAKHSGRHGAPKDLGLRCVLSHGNNKTELDMFLAQYMNYPRSSSYYPIFAQPGNDKSEVTLTPLIVDLDKDGVAYHGQDLKEREIRTFTFGLLTGSTYREVYTGLDVVDIVPNLLSAAVDSFKEIRPLWQFSIDHLENGKFSISFYPQDPSISYLTPDKDSEYYIGEFEVGEKVNFVKHFKNFHMVNSSLDYESLTVDLACKSE